MPGRRPETLGLQALQQRWRWRAEGRCVRRSPCDALHGGTGLQRGVEVGIMGWRATTCLWRRRRRRWPAGRRAAETGAAAQAEHCQQCGDGGCGACLDHRRSPWLDGAHARPARTWHCGTSPLGQGERRIAPCRAFAAARRPLAYAATQRTRSATTRALQAMCPDRAEDQAGRTCQFSTIAGATPALRSATSAGNDASTALRKRAANAALLAW